MTDHVTLLYRILEGEDDLERAQIALDLAREMAPTSQLVQLTLDRRQAEIDETRANLEICKFNIPNSN